jgi:hypothetical protein
LLSLLRAGVGADAQSSGFPRQSPILEQKHCFRAAVWGIQGISYGKGNFIATASPYTGSAFCYSLSEEHLFEM